MQKNSDHAESAASDYRQLARWLRHVLQGPPLSDEIEEHISNVRQLPDLIQAQLQANQPTPIAYAPLLFHLVGCETCFQEYLHLYDALRFALQEHIVGTQPRQWEGNTGGLQRMLAHLCHTLIHQAKLALEQTPSDETYNEARTYLQLAIRLSVRIREHHLRSEALRDLLYVATMSESRIQTKTQQNDLAAVAFTPDHRTQARVTRDAIPMKAAEQHHLPLRSRQSEGTITQNGSILILHLWNLEERFRDCHIIISVLLGSLFEPVRWIGGNPRAVQNPVRVSQSGKASIVIGETSLRLVEEDDYRLLEVIFSLLEIHSDPNEKRDGDRL